MQLDRNTPHAVLATPNMAEKRTQDQIITLKHNIRILGEGLVKTYHEFSAPRFAKEKGALPASINEVGQALADEPVYRAWSDLQQTAQEMMWQSVGDTIFREEARITQAANDLVRLHPAGGSLILDPRIERPDDVMVVDIHGQPGGYMRFENPEDVIAGAFYENGGNVYVSGIGNGTKDTKAAFVIDHLNQRTAGTAAPRRILDLGCSVGGATLSFKLQFPNAEIHAVDVGPGMLRYGHARAESMGLAIHFRQMNAVNLGYDDGSFDLIVAHNLMHEVSTANLQRILAETYRVLAPGGMAIFQDVPIRYQGKPLIDQFMSSWQTVHNNEPHWDAFATCDVPGMMRAAGFPPDTIISGDKPRIGAPGVWYVASAIKPQLN